MGTKGSRVIQVDNIEYHLEQCQELSQKGNSVLNQNVPFMDSCISSITIKWSSTLHRPPLKITLLPTLFTTWCLPTYSLSPSLHYLRMPLLKI